VPTLLAGAAWFCYTSLAFIAGPSYDESGALVDGGADLTIGGMSSYYHDIVYVAVFLLLATALVSDWFWFIGLVVRCYAVTLRFASRVYRIVASTCERYTRDNGEESARQRTDRHSSPFSPPPDHAIHFGE
jgi:hypothetical protein